MTVPKFRAWLGSEIYDKTAVYDEEFCRERKTDD